MSNNDKTRISGRPTEPEYNTKHAETTDDSLQQKSRRRAGTRILGGTQKGVVGLLVSYSLWEEGEYWILREGKFEIGSSPTCQVSLRDAAVSGLHALLHIRRSRNDHRLLVAVMDQQSTNGTLVNGVDIEYGPQTLKDRDIIKVGSHELLMVLIDRVEYGLKLNPELQNAPSTFPRSNPYDSPPDSDNEGRLTSPYD